MPSDNLRSLSPQAGTPSLPGGAPGSLARQRQQEISSVMHEMGYSTREVLDWLIARCAAGASAPGSNGELLFNDGGVTAGDAGLTFDKTTGTLTAGKLVVSDGLYGTWKLYTVPFDYGGGTGLVVASPTAAIEIIACGDMFVEACAIIRTGFDIGKGETITCTIGVSGDESSLVTTMDMATAGTIGTRTAGNLQITTPVQLFVTGSVDLNNLTAGQIDVYVRRVFLATVSEF